MARDYAKHCPVSPMKNCLLVTAVVLLIIQAASCQRVRVETEVEAYPTESVDLRCQFVDGGNTKLTQVSWIWEPTEGQRDNIAVFHPTYGESFPESPFTGRVRFIHGTLTNPSITITSLKMADAGRYTCEYATYPSGNEQGTTNLVMLAKPKNSASPVIVQAITSGKPVVVAQCEAADGKPAATINWMGAVGGTENTTSKKGPDGTVTVRSEYLLVPTPEDNGKEVTCIISQRTQDKPQTFPMKLSVEYPPTVSIVGYDNNWYIGRTDAVLTCQATGNPAPTTVTWTVMSGSMPDTVQINANKLIVRKVDEAVNTTFVCEVKNRLGVSKHQVTTAVIEQRKITAGPSTAGIIGGIIGVVLLLVIIGAVIILVRKRKQNAENRDGPPKHKPPPPVKAGSSTEMLNKPVTDPVTKELTETQPFSNVYYETSGEPVTDLDACDDDDGNTTGGGAANGGGHAVLEDSIQYADVETVNDEALPPYSDADGHHVDKPPSAAVARGESFVSAAMYV
ncbi:poliovirus receptor homolog isoform X3 [Coregonus clupeaformis]|uniref:poliovirus receptor homolog isoform X3 n=1 Tax=Coregonus clupeaformis TaxID=59861 RepID=UPI001E1C8FB7|nr:poliovirus receptor homolog isoform X3 [Coregonus clupeaformis]